MLRLLIIFALLVPFKVFASNAVGVIVGDPSGLSARFALDNEHSIDGALAYATGANSGFHIHGTYLWDRARTFPTDQDPIEMYYGLGARIISIDKGKYDGDVSFGPRAPIGLLYNFTNPNLEVFGEIAAVLDLTPKMTVDLDVGVGVRVRF